MNFDRTKVIICLAFRREMLSLGEYTDKDMVKSLARAVELLTEENKELRQEIKDLRTAPAMWFNINKERKDE